MFGAVGGAVAGGSSATTAGRLNQITDKAKLVQGLEQTVDAVVEQIAVQLAK